ncbi:MAG TPA: ArgE/DapE family deacylase [Microbacterium sp.]|nr:ArgE/DapE family deacylase [Microbacterium sp.]
MTAAETDRILDAGQERLLALASHLITVDSQIPPYGDERAIVAELQRLLPEWGLPAGEVLAPNPERPSLIVRIPGSGGGPTLMLCGHIDTKPVGQARDEWNSDPLEPVVTDGNLYGLGATDMKGAIAAMIAAVSAIRESGTTLAGDVVLALVADEEGGAGEGAQLIAPLISDVDACLIGEPSGWQYDWQGIHLVSRGVCCFRVTVSGTQMHSSLSNRLPVVNASEKMAGLLADMQREFRLDVEPHRLGGVTPTVNPGVMVSGGTFFGVVPGRAEFACDIRTLPGMTRDDVAAALDAWLDERRRRDPALDVEYRFEPGLDWIPPAELDADHPLVGAAQRAAEAVLGEAPPLSVFPGGTDAPWFERAGIPTLPSLGPGMITSAHGPNEHVSVKSLYESAKIYARIVLDYCGAATPEKEGS